MKKRLSLFGLAAGLILAGCTGGTPSISQGGGSTPASQSAPSSNSADSSGLMYEEQREMLSEDNTALEEFTILENNIVELESGLSAVRFDGDYGFDTFLERGGASSDGEVARYLAETLIGDLGLDFLGNFFGCSTITAKSPGGDVLFGRNFDWNRCDAMIVEAHPENGYASLSTVNMDFITQSAGGPVGEALQLDQVKTMAALYAPLDGMNEKGLAVSVNMIQDSAGISQNTGKPCVTTTTAVRLLLDKAASVEEALELLRQYDLHASMGYMVHFALADASGRSVAVEYIGNQMSVIETQTVTNFYLTPGEKYGIGTTQSHTRYEILNQLLEKNAALTPERIWDALKNVSKGNFGEFESTEWSIVMNLTDKTAWYYHREDYDNTWLFAL